MSPLQPRSLRQNSSNDALDEEYFDKTYVPLSSLPTPPLSYNSNASSRRVSYEHGYGHAEYLNPNLLGKLYLTHPLERLWTNDICVQAQLST